MLPKKLVKWKVVTVWTTSSRMHLSSTYLIDPKIGQSRNNKIRNQFEFWIPKPLIPSALNTLPNPYHNLHSAAHSNPNSCCSFISIAPFFVSALSLYFSEIFCTVAMIIEAILTHFPIDSSCILCLCWLSTAKNDADPFLTKPPIMPLCLWIPWPPSIDRRWSEWQKWTLESDNHIEWQKWSYKLEKAYDDQWKRTYLYDLIKFYRHGISLYENLLAATSCF